MKFLSTATFTLSLLAPVFAWADGAKFGDTVDVMTQNQYLGADLSPVIAATDPKEFNQALIATLEQVAGNNYPARVRKLAQLIARRAPDLVGLQEISRFHCTETGLGEIVNACASETIANAFNDHLEETLGELARLGRPYVNVAIVNNFDLTGELGIPEFPFRGLPVDLDFDGLPDIAVTVLDRDMILAREAEGIQAAAVPFSSICGQTLTLPDGTNMEVPGVPGANNSSGCNYQNVLMIPTSLEDEDGVPISFEVQRGLVGVDALVRNKLFRFVNTHLEINEPIPAEDFPSLGPDEVPGGSVQAAQATELNALVTISLLAIPNQIGGFGVPSPIIVGDINSDPRDGVFTDPASPFPEVELYPPYMQLANGVDLFGEQSFAPLTDVWTKLLFPRPGFTCCQLADLSNPYSILTERIDVIFSAEDPDRVRRGRVLGARLWDKTWSTWPDPLWPSDHGSVAAELKFE